MQIALIDDDPISILVCETLMRKLNFSHEIESFDNPDAALQFFADRYSAGGSPPHILFLDVQMPMMTGWEFLEAYAKLLPTPTAHVVMLSASFNPQDRELAKSHPLVHSSRVKPLSAVVLNELQLVS